MEREEIRRVILEEVAPLIQQQTDILLAAISDSTNQEERFMADALEQALTDITTAVGAAVTEIQTLAGQLAAGGTEPAQVAASLETLAGNLNSAVSAAAPPATTTTPADTTTAAPAPAPAPAAPAGDPAAPPAPADPGAAPAAPVVPPVNPGGQAGL